MKEKTYHIGHYEFHTEEEYQAGIRDAKKIMELNVEDTADYRTAFALLKVLREKDIEFESCIGGELLDEIYDCIRQYRIKLGRKAMEIGCYVVIACCILFFVIDGISGLFHKEKTENTQAGIAMEASASMQDSMKGEENKTFVAKEVDIDKILPEYRAMYEKNRECVGWLAIQNTAVSYPVMQTDNNTFYLSHNIDKTYDKSGLLVLDTRCEEEGTSPQYFIYGQNMQDGSMFGQLLNYQYKSYYNYHPSIRFDSLLEYREFEIAFAFEFPEDEEFSIYACTNWESEEEFQDYIGKMQKLSLYDTGVVPEFGQPLLTLVACDDSVENGRMVVIAVENSKK